MLRELDWKLKQKLKDLELRKKRQSLTDLGNWKRLRQRLRQKD